jgi:outer membrane protein
MTMASRIELKHIARACLLLAAWPTLGWAQPAPATLSLEEAIGLARQYSPEHRIVQNQRTTAEWAVREAYGSLLPRVNVSSGMTYQAEGTPTFGLFTGDDLGLGRTPAYYFSNYNLGVNLSLNGGTFFRISEQRASRAATEARIDAAGYTLASEVTRHYLVAARARDAVAIAERELSTAEQAFQVAEARVEAGAATRLDVAQAEVERGRAEVAVLQARHAFESARLELLQRLGVELDREFELTTGFRVFEPAWTRAELVADAMQAHPQLRAARAGEDASRASARSARMAYLPTISAFGALSGYTRQAGDDAFLITQASNQAQGRIESCALWNSVSAGLSQPLANRPADCSQYALTPEQQQRILDRNNVFPFDFTQQPPQFGVTISLPIVDGLTRERSVQQSRIAAADAQERRRAEELAIRARIATTLNALETAFRTVAIEERNVAAAEEHFQLASERYRLGAGSILELTQAQATRARADQAHLAAVYSFHENLALLEAAVGRPLR